MSELHITFFYQIVKMFLIMAIGFLAVKARLIPASAGKGVSQLAAFIVKPCAILYAFQVEYSPEKALGFLLALFAAILTHVVFIVISRLLGTLYHFSPVEKASMIYTNSGNLLMPLVAATMGQEWLFYSCAYMGALQGFVWIHGKSLICEERQIDWKRAFLNVNIISIVLGVFFFFTQLRFPALLGEAVGSVSSMQGSINMLSIGISFATFTGLNLRKFSKVLLVTLHRLIIFPAIMLAVFFVTGMTRLLPDAHQILLIVLLASGAPSGVVVTQIAQIYGKDEQQSSLINVFTMIASILTMPALIWIYECIF